jgi:hypothetical protein
MWSSLYHENEDGGGHSYVKMTSPLYLESEEEDENLSWKLNCTLKVRMGGKT